MNPEDRDEEMLREFLEGDSPLSRLYRRDAREQPSAQLDAAILAEARRSLAPKSRVAHGPFARHWVVPTSLAAVLVLSVSIVLLMPDPDHQLGVDFDSVADTPGAAGNLADAPETAASGEGMPAPANAPLVTTPAMEREQDSAAEDRSTGGRASGLVPLQAPAKQQRAVNLSEYSAKSAKEKRCNSRTPPPANNCSDQCLPALPKRLPLRRHPGP